MSKFKLYQVSTTNCPPCNKAKTYFNDLSESNPDFEYGYIDIKAEGNLQLIKDLGITLEGKTVPQFFNGDGEYISSGFGSKITSYVDGRLSELS